MSLSVTAPVFADRRRLAIPQHVLIVGVSVLMILPSMLFAMGLQPLPAIAVVAGSAGGFALISTGAVDPSATVDPGRLAICTLIALALLVLGGETHLFFANWDWLTRDAVLADLVRGGLPVAYRIDGVQHVLRAPLGMYMLPAAIGQVFGLGAAHGAMLVQNALLLGAIFALLSTFGRGYGHLVILVLFAGLSLVGAWMRIGGIEQIGTPFWLQWGLDGWHPMFQYSSTLVQIFWVPNHALPGWWLATLILLQVRGRADVATLGVSVAGALFWSPLSVVPVAPWLVFCALRSPRKVLGDRRTWLGALAALCFIPVALYLVAGTGEIAAGGTIDRPDFGFWYRWFVVLQLPALAFIALAWRRIASGDRAPLIIAAVILLALPVFRFGPNNDLVMRASIVPLALVAFVFGDVLMKAVAARSILAVLGWLLVVASAPSALVEIGRALATPSYAISTCSLMEASRALDETGAPASYVAPRSSFPGWLLDASGIVLPEAVKQDCWPHRTGPRFFGTPFNAATD